MITRWLFLILGGFALAVGLVLSLVWWKAPARAPAAARTALRREAVLVAARAIGPGTLLLPRDVRWQRMLASRVPPDSLVRGRVAQTAFWGAALRQRFPAGAPLLREALVEPGAPGFLPAALAPGMRAVSLALSGAEDDPGLVEPGDRVDVILTQNFGGPHIPPTRRSVGEVVLRARRVVAVGRRIAPARVRRRSSSRFVPERRRQGPRTVTLEVTSRQAAELMVATRLGSLQLALVSSAKGGARPFERRQKAVWAVDVSPALGALAQGGVPQSASGGSGSGSGFENYGSLAVAIVRGTDFKWRCFDAAERALASCSESTSAVKARRKPRSRAPGKAGTPRASARTS